VTVTIYVEGGGDAQTTRTRCREGFARYCEKVAPSGRRPRIVACGTRNDAFHRFQTAISVSDSGEHCALLVDSEGPVAPNTSPAAYLRDRDRWNCPDLQNHPVFLMVQAMEAWFFADRAALVAFYGPGFRLNALRGHERDVEAIPKGDLTPSLLTATNACKTKGVYHKTRHAFEILASLEPEKVGKGSPHAAALNAFLRNL